MIMKSTPVPPLALAAMCRPELPVTVGLLAIAFVGTRRWRSLFAPALLWLGLLVPHLVHVAGVVGSEQGRAGLPGLTWERLGEAPAALVRWGVPVDPTLFSVGAWGFVLAAFAANKVQGFALMKASGVFTWPAILAWWVRSVVFASRVRRAGTYFAS